MSHEDETTPVWKTEEAFERQPAGDGEPETSWEHLLSHWASPERGAPAPASPAAPAQVDQTWLTQPLDEVSTPPHLEAAPASAVEPEVAAPEVAAPDVAPPPAAAPPGPIALPSPPVEPSSAVDETSTFELPPEPEPEPERAVLPEPEEEVAETKVPFYKRELSLKRKPKAAKPTREREPKGERKPKRERAPKEEPAAGKLPFYRRDLSFGRKPKGEPSGEPKRELPEPAKRERRQLRLPSLPKLERGGGKNAKKIVGLKIGASQIAAARVLNGDSPQLLQAVSAPLEQGIVVGGELRDPEALAEALRVFFKRHNLPRTGIRLGIANNRIGVRTLEVVGIEDPKQLDNAIKFRAQEVLPIPIEDAVLDYQVLAEAVDEEGQASRRVLLVVAYRDLVDRYVDACRKAGLDLVGIDLEAFALLRALAEPPSELQPLPGVERGALVAVAVGHERSTFAISDGRTCEFTRVLQWGGWALNVAIARALDTSPSEAEEVKRALSFAGPEELPNGFNADQLATAREAARNQLQGFARELVSSLQFYQNQPGSLGIGEIVITGGTSHLPGLAAELERLVGVPVRTGDPLGRVRLAKNLGELEQVGSLAVAIGLGIED